MRKALAAGLFINAARLTDELDVRMSGGWAGGQEGRAARLMQFPSCLLLCLPALLLLFLGR